MISSIVIFGLVALIMFWYVRDSVRNAERNKLLSKFSNKYPIRTFPFVGHMWRKDGIRLLNEFLAKKSVSPFVVWLGMIPAVNVTKLEDVEEVLQKCHNINFHGLTEGMVEDGILFTNSEKWKKTKRLLTPAFAQGMLKQYIRAINKHSEVLVDLLRQKAIEGELFDLWPFLINAQIDTLTKNMMGVKSDCQRNQRNEYSEAFSKVVSMMWNRGFNPLLYSNFLYKIYLHFTGLSRHIELLHEYPRKKVSEILQNRNDRTIQNRERTLVSSASRQTVVDNEPRYLIDLLLVEHMKDPNYMTEKQVGVEIVHMIGAGSETSAITVGLLLLMYGIHQAEQETVYQEIKRIIPEDRPITVEDLNQLDYMQKTIKETSRFFSILSIVTRVTDHAITLSSGLVIPKGTDVLVHLRSIHENPLYYPNPNKWNPKNFDTEAMESRPKNSFAAFSLGLRSCIGSKYAMLSIKIQVCHLLRKYHISTDTKLDQIVMDQDILRRSRDGYRVKLSFRDIM